MDGTGGTADENPSEPRNPDRQSSTAAFASPNRWGDRDGDKDDSERKQPFRYTGPATGASRSFGDDDDDRTGGDSGGDDDPDGTSDLFDDDSDSSSRFQVYTGELSKKEYDRKGFLKQVVQLDSISLADAVTFYTQLYNQGRIYGIPFRRMEDIDIWSGEVCGHNCHPKHQLDMAVAVYMLLMHPGTLPDEPKITGIKTIHSSTGDGFKLLFQVLKVCIPTLQNCGDSINIQKWSDLPTPCLHIFVAEFVTYYLLHLQQGRCWTPRDKALEYLNAIEDDEFGMAAATVKERILSLPDDSTLPPEYELMNLPFRIKALVRTNARPVVRAAAAGGRFQSRGYPQET